MLDLAATAIDDLPSECDPIALLRQAVALEMDGKQTVARALMQSVATLTPMWDEPWLRIGQSWRNEGCFAEAACAYDAALARNPHRVEALIARGVTALLQQAPAESATYLRRAIDIAPDHDQAWHALGYANAALGLHGAAAEAIAAACRLKPSCFRYALDFHELVTSIPTGHEIVVPEWSDGVKLALAGRAARAEGALDEAIDALEAAATLILDDPEILKQLAAVYLVTMRPEAAEPLLREAHRLAPDDAGTLNDLGVTLGRLYRYGEAAAFMEKIKIHLQATPQMLLNRATMRASIGDFEGSRTDLEAAKTDAGLAAALQPECALLPYRSGMTAAILRDAMVTLGNAFPRGDRPFMNALPITLQDRDRPLRIGLLSNALRQHPVAWLTFAGFKALDRANHVLHCFGHYEPEDSFAPGFARHVAGWHDIDACDDAAAARLIASHDIDILFDLSGFGDGGRIGVTAYRPAPVQIKWVGSQACTTGMSAIDWMITDRWETPEGYERFYTERLLRLPDGYVCYTPPPVRTDVTPLPALTNGFVTFGCFNNLAKLTDDTLRLWARLLHRVPNARLKLRCPQFSEATVNERFVNRAESLGLAPERITLEGRAPHPVFIASYGNVDIALDPYPYSGGLTTCEALFMGVPVITLAGDFFAARHSVSHLSNVGVEGCIATTPDEYIDKGAAMAADLVALARLRGSLRQRVVESPLCDAARFGKHLGDALRFVWHDYCDGAG